MARGKPARGHERGRAARHLKGRASTAVAGNREITPKVSTPIRAHGRRPPPHPPPHHPKPQTPKGWKSSGRWAAASPNGGGNVKEATRCMTRRSMARWKGVHVAAHRRDGQDQAFENMREASRLGRPDRDRGVRRVQPAARVSRARFRPKKYKLLRTRNGATRPTKPCAPAISRAKPAWELVKGRVSATLDTILPDVAGLLEATRTLAREGFSVLPIHQRTTGPRQEARGRRGGGGDAARRANRTPAWALTHPYTSSSSSRRWTVRGSSTRGSARLGARSRGARLRRRALTHRHRGSQGSCRQGPAMKWPSRGRAPRLKAGASRRKLYRTASSTIEGVPDWRPA